MILQDLDHLRDNKAIRFKDEVLPNGELVTIVSYMVADSKLWELPNALECRGIVFNANGECICRPFEKFFNVGEREDTQLNAVETKTIKSVTDKRDGSMVTPVLVGLEIYWKTKKSFYSDVAINASRAVFSNELELAKVCLRGGFTPIFEYTDRKSQIVIDYGKEPTFTLLAIRHNFSGEYLSYQQVSELADKYYVRCIDLYAVTINDMLTKCASETVKDFEGYVIEFTDGQRVKLKTDWYIRNHRVRTELRERDVADMVVNETIDDVKSFVVQNGYDVEIIHAIEDSVVAELDNILESVTALVEAGVGQTDKEFAIANKANQYFGLAMNLRKNQDIDLAKFWNKVYRESYALTTVYSNFIGD